MARVVTTETMTKIALYMTLPASAPMNSPTASLVGPPVAISPASSSGTATNAAVSTTATAYLLQITTDRGTGVASRCTMLPSSTSAPSTLVPMISAVSGSTTVKPKTPSTWLGQEASCGCASLISTVTSRISGGIANSRARLRPMAARSVIEVITRPWTPNMMWLLSPGSPGVSGPWAQPSGSPGLRPVSVDEVGEHAFQGLVLGQQLAQPDALVPGQRRDLAGERPVVAGPDRQPVVGYLHPGHGRPADQRGAEPPVVRGAHQEDMRPAGHQPPDGPEVTGGGEPARDHHLDGAGQPFHLFQDVRAEQDRPALLAQPVQQIHHVQPLPRVHAVERLVEQQYLGIVHQRPGHPDPLPHALGVGGDLPVLRAAHLDDADGPPGGRVGVGQLVQPRAGPDELRPGEERVHRVPLGHQPERVVDVRVAPARGAADGELAARRREEPGDHVQQRGLARAVRAEQAGHAGPDGHRDVVDRHHVAVPAGDVAQFDRAHAAPTLRYLAARPARLAASSTRNMTPYR